MMTIICLIATGATCLMVGFLAGSTRESVSIMDNRKQIFDEKPGEN